MEKYFARNERHFLRTWLLMIILGMQSTEYLHNCMPYFLVKDAGKYRRKNSETRYFSRKVGFSRSVNQNFLLTLLGLFPTISLVW